MVLSPAIAKHVERLYQLKGENARTMYLLPMSAAKLVLIGREMGAAVNDSDTYASAGAAILRHLASNSTVAPTPAPKIVFQGIQIPQGLLGMTHGRKFKSGRVWQLTTRKGHLIGDFRTKAMLEKWWIAFQESQGRIALPLQDGLPGQSRPQSSKQPYVPSLQEGAARDSQLPRPSKPLRRKKVRRTYIGEVRPPTKPSPEDFGKEGHWW
jgi:hypothetical protein